jgi:peptidoglycan hydrolase-like protein with peptidoglycan-binding domain
MALKSHRFADQPRLEAAANNKPPIKQGERGEAIRRMQQALVDYGLEMPITTKRGTSPPDGIFGAETRRTVLEFQNRELLDKDGIAGRQTIGRLDELFTVRPIAQIPSLVNPREFAVTTSRRAKSG